MNLLLIDQYGEMGGAQRCLVEAAAGFSERGWELHALVPPGRLQQALAPYCLDSSDLPCGPFASASKTLRDAALFARQIASQRTLIKSAAERHNVDAIYVNGPRVLPAAGLGRCRRPLIYHSHWMVPQAAAAALARAALRGSSASAIATSRLAADWLRPAIAPHRLTTIYNGVAGFGLSPRPRDAIRHIAVLGRVSAEKGQLEFVQAARQVSGPRFSICGSPMFTGDTYFDRVRAEAAGFPIEFPGWTEDIGGFLAGVDLLVVPSGGIDNIPRVILEAFAAGVPVLAFESGAIPELVQHGETGLLIREKTPQAMAAAMKEAVRRPETLNRIAARAYQLWRERYTLRRFQAEICDAVESATRRDRKPLASAGASAPA